MQSSFVPNLPHRAGPPFDIAGRIPAIDGGSAAAGALPAPKPRGPDRVAATPPAAGPGFSQVGAGMDQQAFETAVRTYSADLFRFAYWLSRNHTQAQDLVQDAFMAAWKARDSLREPAMFKSWLFAILRNEHARGFQRKRLELADDQELDELPSASPVSEQERVELHDLLRALPETYREPLVLQVLGGFSGKEIADMLGITEQNVMVRLTRARQSLKRLASPGTEHEEQVL